MRRKTTNKIFCIAVLFAGQAAAPLCIGFGGPLCGTFLVIVNHVSA